MKVKTYKRSVSFLDANGHRAKITCEITYRNGYPEFTAFGEYLGSFGQCLDSIKPRNEAQEKLLLLWEFNHLEDLTCIKNQTLEQFKVELIKQLDAIEEAEEDEIELSKDSTGEQFLKQMEEYGVQEEYLAACQAYVYAMGATDLSEFEEAFCGCHDSDEDFAEYMAESVGAIDEDAQWPNNCIDWEHAARELMYDYTEHDGFYFRNL